MRPRTIKIAAIAFAFALLTGCGNDSADETSSGGDTPGAGDCSTLALKKDGVLTVATGDPAFEPWVVDDDPANGKGYEAAVVRAVADELGIDQVDWVRTGFDEAIAPGTKDYDFNVQQYSITPERSEVVDFSRSYYKVQQALVGRAGSDIAGAKTLADLKGAKLGASIGSTSLDYAENVIQPDTQVQVFDSDADAKAAFDAGQVDAILWDLPTAYYITAVEIEDADIIGVLPSQDGGEDLGFLFEKGSELVPCVNQALDTLDENGTLAKLQTEWLARSGEIPAISE